jgi:restriction system protein
MAQAGLVENTRRGHFKATRRGLDVLARNPSRVNNELLMEFEEFRQFRERRRESDPLLRTAGLRSSTQLTPEQSGSTPEEMIAEAVTEITDSIQAELLEKIMGSPPYLFEKLVVDLLLRMGYGGARTDAGRTVGGTGDGGVDGIINEDALGLDVVYVQAKR